MDIKKNIKEILPSLKGKIPENKFMKVKDILGRKLSKEKEEELKRIIDKIVEDISEENWVKVNDNVDVVEENSRYKNLNKFNRNTDYRKRALILCQRKTGKIDMNRPSSKRVENKIVPDLERYVKDIIGEETKFDYVSNKRKYNGEVDFDFYCGDNILTQKFVLSNKNRYDLVMLHTCPFIIIINDEKSIRKIYDLLKPGGKLFFKSFYGRNKGNPMNGDLLDKGEIFIERDDFKKFFYKYFRKINDNEYEKINLKGGEDPSLRSFRNPKIDDLIKKIEELKEEYKNKNTSYLDIYLKQLTNKNINENSINFIEEDLLNYKPKNISIRPNSPRTPLKSTRINISEAIKEAKEGSLTPRTPPKNPRNNISILKINESNLLKGFNKTELTNSLKARKNRVMKERGFQIRLLNFYNKLEKNYKDENIQRLKNEFNHYYQEKNINSNKLKEFENRLNKILKPQ